MTEPKSGASAVLSRWLCGLCTGAFLATPSFSALALPLPKTSFDQLAPYCAPGIELATLQAVASVESHFEPWAVQDNTTHESWTPPSLASATLLVEDRLRKGHSVDIGLMQINSGNLASLGLKVSDALDPCRSLEAASRILVTAFAAGSSEAERQAAVLITLSRYNTGRPLAGISNGYANRVITARGASPTRKLALQDAPNTPKQWDIWGTYGAELTSWVVTADRSSEIERAGAQSTEARAELRATALPSRKGEPYEVFAYQESEPNRP